MDDKLKELTEKVNALTERADAAVQGLEAAQQSGSVTPEQFAEVKALLEHQAVRRMEGGGLSEEEIERLGMALLRLQERLEEIKHAFGLEDEDLNVDLGPLGRLL